MTCAVRHATQGPQIDAHDVVVHVNNKPTREYQQDMGTRTDLLFTTLCAVREVPAAASYKLHATRSYTSDVWLPWREVLAAQQPKLQVERYKSDD